MFTIQSFESKKQIKRFFQVQLLRVRQIFTIIVFLTSLLGKNTIIVRADSTGLVCETFESLTLGSYIGSSTSWTDDGAGPVVTAGIGVASSIGLTADTNIFNWSDQFFNWNAANFQKINLQGDFQSNNSGQFDDDRLSWTIDGTSTSSNNQFGVQLDPGGIVTYWSNTIGGSKINDVIVPLSGLTANAWYRFTAEITKLTATSAKIDVSLVLLDASGNPTGTPFAGSIADTSALASGHTPAAGYFTATTMVPSYKNFNTIAGATDNLCYEFVTATSTPTITVTGTLNPFTSQAGVASAEQSYTVAGSGLTENIVITPPADFEVSTTIGSGFGLSVTLTPSSGTVASTPIYVRFNRATEGASSGNITQISSGATTRNMAVSGTAVLTPTQTLPINAGSTWKYLDNGTDQGTAWKETAFNDSTWASGPAELGYGDGGEATVVDCSAVANCTTSNYITTYFRKSFNVPDPSMYSGLNLRLLRDDGAVVYLNGTEVWRTNMPTGSVTSSTLASVAIGGTDETTFVSPASALANTLVNGTNVLAVEIHQSAITSTDVSFDLELTGVIAAPTCYALTLGHTGNGTTPTATPANSTGCSSGQYISGEVISLTGATPDSGWQIAGWYGTSNNTSTASTNSLTMPASVLSAGVNYTASTATVTFQEGVSSYTGTVDTHIRQLAPTTTYGTSVTLEWDSEDGTAGQASTKYALLRFDNIFGSGVGQIPAGSTITSATLQYVVSNVTANAPSSVNEVLVDWTESTTYNSFGSAAGVQAEDYGVLVTTAPATSLATYTIDITSSLAAWSGNPTSNRGWIIRPAGTDGVQIASSDNTTVANRPKLTVTYSATHPTPPAAPSALAATTPQASQVHLTWIDNANNESGFELERSTTGISGTYSPLTTLASNTVAYDDPNLTPLQEYCYRVRAVNGSGQSSYAGPVCATPIAPEAFDLGTGSAYVTFGDPAGLDLAQFTIETWFKRTGTGTPNTTGTSGITSAVPLVTHGSPQGDGSNIDANWVLVIDDTNDVIAADFEDMATGLNHPVYGTTPITNNIWHHAAATYDGTTWRLYLDGNLEATLAVNAAPRSDTTQRAGLGTMIESGGAAHGYFQGMLDETRVWNYARTQAEIRSDINTEITTSQTGLVARWALDDGGTTTIVSSAGTTVNGTISGTGYAWVTPGAPYNLSFNQAPAQPALVQPLHTATGVGTSPVLTVSVSDPDSEPMDVTFFGRQAGGSTGENFTIVVLPDTQNYSASYPATFTAQTQWIVNNKVSKNIVYVAHEGDIVNDASITSQWTSADAAMDLLDAANISYGVVPGNHDEIGGTTNYNNYFGVNRFCSSYPTSCKSFYGGAYPTGDNQNNYTLFSASGMDFIVINLDYTSPAAGTLDWADALLKADTNRRGIVVSHDIVGTGNPASFSTWGQSIYTALSDNPNLFLMMNGHTAGEGQRKDGNIYSLLADYQNYTNGGNGYLRIMEFSPSTDTISVKTYSPILGTYETDTNSEFTLTYDMDAGAPFVNLGTDADVLSGTNASITWSSLLNNTQYEWYAVASDGLAQATSTTWNFTTKPANTAPVANDQEVTVAEDGVLEVTLTASDVDSDPLTYTVLTQPAHGSLTGTAPNLTYTPAADFNGSDSFTFKANDGTADSNTATVTINITPVNDAPVCLDVTLTTNEDVIGQTDPSCTDIENDPLTYAIVAQPVTGSASVVSSKLEYIPTNNYHSTTSFTYKANDGGTDSNTATVNVTVNSVNDVPVAVPDNYTTAEDTQLNVTAPGVLGNDGDIDISDTLTAIKLTDPSNGVLALNANGSFTYTPAPYYNGTDSFTYIVNDGTTDGNTVTVTIDVTSVNNAPALNIIGAQTINEGTLLSFTATATDPDLGDTFTFSLIGEPAGAFITLGGTFTWTPAESQGPNIYNFDVCVIDGVLSDCQTVQVTVYESNVAPELGAIGNKSIDEGSELIFTAGAIDTDMPVNTLTFSLGGTPPAGASIDPQTGVFTWTPTEAQGPDTNNFNINVSDGTITDFETITVTVNEVNVAPVADSQSVLTSEDTTLDITLTGLDTDLPANPLTYVVVSDPLHGLLTGTAPALTYTPATNFNGADSFTFTVNDGTVNSDVATVTITVNGANDAPVAADDSSYVIGEDGALTVPAIAGVLNNDSDSDSDPLIAIKVTEPAHGVVTLNTDGSFTYIPVANYYGSDSFTYKANDGLLDSNIATATITVTSVNDAPVAVAQALLTTVNTALNITLTATDADLPADTLTFAVVSQPAHGLFTGTAPALTYTPAANFKGVDSFTFTVNDDTEDSASAVVTIDIKTPECVSPANEIVAENCLAGNPPSEWDVSGAGDTNIQGYATDISVNQGGTIHFKVDTNATDYRLDIYRLGYYDGNGARFIANVNPSATLPQIQPACLFDGTDGINLVDCGNWSESASWAVPSSAASGVYIAKLVREDATTGTSHMVFIVRDDDGNSDLLFQTSDTTWQAYNRYGGYSLYDGPGHAHKVSYNRPFTTRDAPTEDWVFNAEYPMIRWLEQNGYDVSYFTDLDTDRFGSELLEHKVFLSVGHDEYWSAGQRTAVEIARGAGVNLAFFSGNEIYWKTRWEPSTADGGNTPYRTLVSYKEGDAQGSEHYNCLGNFNCDPDPDTWTGLWRQNQTGHDGGQPENSLSGQISWGDTTTAIQVPAWAGNMRFWRNAGITTDTTLTASTLGYEFDWEQAAYASSYPAGRITFSDTTAVGKNHRLSLYRAPSGALVFGAGTVQWSWGLDSTHDRGSSTIDTRIQQATVNILSDMLAQPATLQAGLVPGGPLDTTVPTATITTPADGATVPGGNVTISGTTADVGGLVALVEVSTDGGTTWAKATGTTNWTYTFNAVGQTLNIQARAIDDAANIGTSVTINITAGTQTCPCSIWTPATLGGNYENDTNPVELGVKFRSDEAGYITGLRFWKASGMTGTHIGHLWTAGGAQLGEITFTAETASGWQEATFASPIAINVNTTYIASYHAPAGYAATVGFFTSAGIDSPPLHALANGVDGVNGIYKYGPAGSFPTDTFQSGNYWVDVTFVKTVGPDTTPPVIQTVTPASGASSVNTTTTVTAKFNEAMDVATVIADNFELRDAANAFVPATVTYDPPTRTAVLTPTNSLSLLTVYTATVKTGVKDVAGNALAADYTWNFTTQAPPPDEGPGGPILVVTSTSDVFGRYYAEILRAEGLNAFTVTDISNVNATMLVNYDVVILAHMSLNDTQATLFTDWVNAGGNLIAMRPDARLASLLGLTSEGTSLANAYLLVNTASGPGAGIVNQSIQYHSDADRYTVNGATVIATLYSNATTATTNPAVTIVNVGSNGGQAAAFTFDLARSVVYTRQGNPAWQGINGDNSSGPVRADDMFHNGTDPDWVDLTKVAIPQADEQQRLLANMIYSMNLDNKPLPRFWYFPRDEKAVVIMTMDEHGGGDLVTRLNRYNTLSPTGCNLNDWECVRSTSYIYTNAQITDAQLSAFQTQGHEFAVHVDTSCSNFTLLSLANNYATQIPALKAQFPSINAPLTQRTHCIAFSDWSSQPKVQLQNGMRLDTNYYYWPDTWVLDRPGMFTGSGMPMRFADLDGTLIDVYQAATQMTDESGQTLATHIDTLLNNAVGASGYYGVFTANMHTDGGTNASNGAESIIASAQVRGVPVVSAEQMLAWLDGRNNSSFSAIDFQNDILSFHVTTASGSNGLRAMLPMQGTNGPLTGITRNGSPVTYATLTVKGVQYASFDALTGDYQASYMPDTVDPVISGVNATVNPDGTATITWMTDELSASRVDYGTTAGSLTSNVADAALVTSHTLTLSGLIPNTTYHYRVSSTDASNNMVVSPEPPAAPLTFATPAIPLGDDTVTDFTAGTLSCNYVSSTSDGELILPPVVGTEFSGAFLPSGWNVTNWNGNGNYSVNNGVLTFDDALVAYGPSDGSFGPGRSLEFVATISANNSQHLGFGTTLDGDPWAIFSTGFPGGTVLKARSWGTTQQETSLPDITLGVPHLFRIDWTSTSVTYYVDGTQVASHAVAIPVNMRPLFSDITNPGPNASSVVDWMRMSPFTGPCTFTSRVFDAGSTVNWQALNWTAGLSTDTSLAFSYRLGDTSAPDGTWLPFMDVPASGTPISGSARYAQYRVTLDAANALVTPIVQDVLFTYSTEADTTAPTITNRLPAVDATNVAIDSSITVTFNEVLASATVDGTTVYLRKLGDVANVPAIVTLVGNIVTVDPSASLAKGTTYTVTVKSGITDMVGNPLGADSAWNFTTVPDSVADTTVADFSAGSTVACVVDATIGNGAVRLPLTIDENFLGTTLPAGWSSGIWNAGGTASVSDGTLVVDGARGYSNLSFGPGVSLEFRATFTATNFQNIGFTADGAFNAPWIVIGEGNNSDGVYARTDTGDTILLSTTTLGTPHIYRIDWTASGFAFYVDGTLATTIARAVTGNMVVNISDYNTGGGTLTADWVRVTPYVSPCTFESRVLDAGQFADWLDLSWDGASPTGTTVGFETRSGNSSAPDGSWSNWQAVNSPIASPNGRYIQYRATLESTQTEQTPVIESVNLTYLPIANSAPIAVADSYSTAEDIVLNVSAPGVLGNDTDAELNALTALMVTDVSHGTLALNADGSFIYTPAALFHGEDSFTYKANDGTIDGNIVTVTITVTSVNNAPVCSPVSLITAEDTNGQTDPSCTDADGDTLIYSIVGPATSGTSFVADGKLSYVPNLNFNGGDAFTYKASDGVLDSNSATVTVTVTAVNDVPVAVDDSGYIVAEDGLLNTVVAAGVLANDVDVDGDLLTTIKVSDPAHGSVTLNADGSLTYTPVADYHGSDSFTYKANDGTADSNIATVTITVTSVNDAPVAVADSYTTAENTQLSVTTPGVLGNDSDVDNVYLDIIKVEDASHGTVLFLFSGAFSYVPSLNFNGTDSFTYKLWDGEAYSDTVTVTINVTSVNNAPVCSPVSLNTAEDTNGQADPSCTDADGDTLTYSIVDPATPGMASVVLDKLTYEPYLNFNGSDSFTYRATDGSLFSDPATVTVTVTPVNDAPVLGFIADQDVDELALLSFTATAGDVDNDPLTFSLNGEPAGAVITAGGAFTWTPTEAQGPNSYTFQVCVGDGGLNDCRDVHVNVIEVNTAPVLEAVDNQSVNEGSLLTFTVIASDADVPANTLTFSLGGTPPAGASIDPNTGVFTWTPTEAQGPDINNFNINVSDGVISDFETITVTVNEVNVAPVAVEQSLSTPEDTALDITLTGTDADLPAYLYILTYTVVSDPSHGALGGIAPDLTYTPDANFNGSDSFTFKVNDGTVDSNVATVSITVNGVNDAPVAVNDTGYTVSQNGTLNVVSAAGVLNNDTDADNDPLTAVKVTDPGNGALNLNFDGSFTYTPNTCFAGNDIFTYKANDGITDSNVATVTVDVSQVNQAPIARAGGPYTADLGSGLMLDGTMSTDPNAGCGDSIAEYQWLVADTISLTGATPSLTAAQINALGVGSHQVRLTVMDRFGVAGVAVTTLSIYDNRPVASFTADPNPAACGQSISFDASGSSHGRPDRSIVNYSWSFGDGGNGIGQITSHTYAAFGSYDVVLTVTDNNVPAKTDFTSILVLVNQGNRAPSAHAGGPYAVDLGSGLTLNGTASVDFDAGCGDSIVSYLWDIDNDGSFDDLSGSMPVMSALQVNTLGSGTHTIRLQVTDKFGVTGVASTTLTVNQVCYPLTLSHSGTGTTPVADPLKSVVCATNGEYVAGELIQLSGATPDLGWYISGWTGTENNSSTASTNTVTMPANAHTASVTYTQLTYTLNITVVGNGAVTKNPDQATYHYGDTVQLSALPDAGWLFNAWSGDVTGSASPVSVTMDGNKNVTATFTLQPPTCTGILYVDVDSTAVTPNGCNWTWAFRTLQDALAAAPANGTTIWVAEGTYYPDEGAGQTNNARTSTFTLENGVSIYGGFAGTETLLSQRDPSLRVTTLSGDIDQVTGNANNSYHIVSAYNLAASAVLDGFTITGGNANSDGTGGGLYNQNGSPTLRNLIFTINTSSNFGGGMYSITSGSTDSSITSPTLTNVTFTGNTAVRGGGLVTMNSNAILTDVAFTNNTATGGAGGGMNNQTASTSNPASVPVLTNVTFNNNTANGGGGLYNGNSNPLLTNVTISGNTANVRGGGILNEGASPTLNNVTISGNTAPAGTGGAIRNIIGVVPASKQSNPLIQNSILWGNNAGGGADEITSDGAGVTTISYSVLENDCQPAGSVCTNIVIGDPLLGTLANHGGFTQTMALGVNSSAIDAGNTAACATTDQRGNTRPQGAACDAGAYEVVALTNLAVTPVIGEYGGKTTLIATLNYNSSGLSGKTIDFTLNGSSVGNAVTNASGVAALGNVNLASINVGVYPAGVTVSFAGDASYASSNGTADLTINKATPVITWANPADIVQGTPLSTTHLNATASVAGTFVYNPPAGTVLAVGNGQNLSADFTPDDAVNYNNASANVTINVYACFALTLEHAGQGADPVADPAHSAGCPAGTYRTGETIQLNGATPDLGWHISGWTGTDNDASTASTNSLTMPASVHTATVNYVQDEYTLTVVSAHGTVTKTPDKATYNYGDVVTLSVTPDAGWTFTDWTPSLTDNTVTITGNTTVTANFTQNEYVLNITIVGNGTVTKNPNQPTYTYGTIVELTPVPNAGWTFTGWSGDASGSADPLNVTMDGNKNITANFASVSIILNAPTGALASWNNTFSWTGFSTTTSWYLVQVQTLDDTTILQKWYTADAAGCAGDLSCAVSPEETLNLANGDYQWRILDYGDYGYGSWTPYTNFNLNAACYTLTTNVLPAGSGTFHATAQNCSGGYLSGTVVQLSVMPNSGYVFANWSGDASGASNPVTITMDADKTVMANFTGVGVTPQTPSGALTSWNNNFSWTGFSNASWYLIQAQAADNTVILQKWYSAEAAGCSGSMACAVAPEETLNLMNGDYKWRILDYGDYGYGNWSVYKDFSLNAACYALVTEVLPVGGGTVTASAQNCSGGYLSGTVVQLTAVANSGYGFSSWSGDVVETSNPVFVTMNADKNITANFTALGATLISPAGALTSWDNTFTWTGLTGASWYLVQVQAVDDIVILQKWYTADAAGCSGDLSCVVSPEETLNLSNGDYKWRILDYGDYGYGNWSPHTNFNLNAACYALTTSVLPVGSGTVTASAQNCSGGYLSGTVVQLTAIANPGYGFSSWSGDVVETSNSVFVTMNADKNITANFTALGATLISPAGALTSWDNTFSWIGVTGASWYLVQVQAVDDTVILQKWYTADAAGCSGDLSCVINPDETLNLTNGDYKWRILDYGDYGYGNWSPHTNFNLNAACYALTTNVLPASSGTVTASAQNCSGGYLSGTVVQLTAVANPGYAFASWSGDVVETSNPVFVTMNADKNITANFTALGATLVSPVGALTSWDNTFIWTGVTGASWYLVQVQAMDDTVILQQWYTADAVGCSGDLSCVISPDETLNLMTGDYKWRILDYGDYGYGSWTPYLTFTLP